PSASSQAAPWWARRLTSPKVTPSARRPSASRSGAASAIMSSRRAVCIAVAASVGGRKLLGFLQHQRAAVEGQRAGPALAGQHHHAGLLVRIALAELGPASLVRRNRPAGR